MINREDQALANLRAQPAFIESLTLTLTLTLTNVSALSMSVHLTRVRLRTCHVRAFVNKETVQTVPSRPGTARSLTEHLLDRRGRPVSRRLPLML